MYTHIQLVTRVGKPSSYCKGLGFLGNWIKNEMSITVGQPLNFERLLVPLKKKKKKREKKLKIEE